MSTKNVTFKLDTQLTRHSRPLILFEEEKENEKRRSSKFSTSFEISTKNSNFQRRSRHSIFSSEIKNSKENFPNIRTDAFGNEINKKGIKNYKVSFIDEISNEKIAEVILVENTDNSCKRKNVIDKNNICRCETCFIF
jgi:hypothetical protein